MVTSHHVGFDPYLEIARGNVPKQSTVHKFGHAPSIATAVETDIWTRAVTTPIWKAPSGARVHDLVSTSALDTSGGAGCRMVRVYGLTSWFTSEEYEDVPMAGRAPVSTTKSWVIIHRMRSIPPYGSATTPNVGLITATAVAPDNYVTAEIGIGQGITQMCMYGIPSGSTLYMKYGYSTMNRGTGTTGNITYWGCNDPVNSPQVWITKTTMGVGNNSIISRPFKLPQPIPGPSMIKVSANVTQNNSDLSSGFDGILIVGG